MRLHRTREIRAGDPERDETIAALTHHNLEHRLSDEDYNRRVASAQRATTIGELDDLLKDLPKLGTSSRWGFRVAWAMGTLAVIVVIALLAFTRLAENGGDRVASEPATSTEVQTTSGRSPITTASSPSSSSTSRNSTTTTMSQATTSATTMATKPDATAELALSALPAGESYSKDDLELRLDFLRLGGNCGSPTGLLMQLSIISSKPQPITISADSRDLYVIDNRGQRYEVTTIKDGFFGCRSQSTVVEIVPSDNVEIPDSYVFAPVDTSDRDITFIHFVVEEVESFEGARWRVEVPH